jgi:pimeloyl-ACP methyl ester carboxylesterase
MESRHANLSKRSRTGPLRGSRFRFPAVGHSRRRFKRDHRGLANHAFNPLEEFSDSYRVIALDLRNANKGQSEGPLEIERTWDGFTDDQLSLMDHLGIDRFMVMGFCIGGPQIWNLLKRSG